MKLILAIACGGAVGAVARHFTSSQVMKLMGLGFPYGTLTVNIVGSFVLGVLVEIMALRWQVGPELRAFLVVGLLGGYTTFSAFSLDTVLLIERGTYGPAALYVLANMVISVAGLFAGLMVMRQVLG